MSRGSTRTFIEILLNLLRVLRKTFRNHISCNEIGQGHCDFICKDACILQEINT